MTPMHSLDPAPFPILSLRRLHGTQAGFVPISPLLGLSDLGPPGLIYSLRDEAQGSMHTCGALYQMSNLQSPFAGLTASEEVIHFYLHSSITSSWQHHVRLDSELTIIWKRWITLVNSHRDGITHWGFIFLIPKTSTLETGQGLHLAK